MTVRDKLCIWLAFVVFYREIYLSLQIILYISVTWIVTLGGGGGGGKTYHGYLRHHFKKV
jgi:hypothetical protein